MQVQAQNCSACGSSHLTLREPRTGLRYACCSDCGHCSQIFTSKDGAESFEEAQNKYYGDESILLESTPTFFEKEAIAERISAFGRYLPKPAKVLEVGPGAGHILRWLTAEGYAPTAVEHSETLARRLAETFNVPVHVGEFEKLPIEPDSLDAFCSFHVIEHVPDPLAHMRQAFVGVRPGGRAFVATPNARSLQQVALPSLSPNFDSAHTFVFSPKSLRACCEKAGWTVIATMTPEYTSGWLRVVTKLLRRMKGEDEEATAGKYATQSSSRIETIAGVIRLLSWPMRFVQRKAGYGNEVFLVLEKRV